MNYSPAEIESIIQGKRGSASLFPAQLHQVVFDSRRIIFPPTSIFFALTGDRNDGHQYLQEAYNKGIRNFVISQSIKANDFPEANCFLVEDTRRALQRLATFHRQKFSFPIIGITGSNGKTIVKEWLFQLLQADYLIVRSPKSYNSQLGVPLSILQIEESHELGIFEAGISTTQEMQYLAPIIDCQIGIFTHLGPAHDEGFGSLQQKVQEKLQLFQASQHLIYCCDNSLLDQEIQQQFPEEKLFRWGKSASVDLQITQIQQLPNGKTTIEAQRAGQVLHLQIPFLDSASVENAIHCWALLLLLEYPMQTIRQRIAQLDPVAMRLELKAAINHCYLLNDSYNSDLGSLNIALDVLDQQRNTQDRMVILSDILQSGQDQQQLYQQVAQLLHAKKIKRLIGIGSAIPSIEPFLSDLQADFYPDTDTFLNHWLSSTFDHHMILLKGARPFQFEKIANRLALKSHNTVLEINLNALLHNLKVYSQMLQPTTQLMVMVKAAAYGSGGDEIARLLAYQKVDYLAVAYTDEGVALRQAGIQLPILVLNPEETTFELMLEHQLEPEVFSILQLQSLLPYLPKKSLTKIHLKLDTGMYRLGLNEATITPLLDILNQNPQIEISSIFSHLAASEDPNHDGFSHEQYQRFIQFYTKISKALGYRPLRHLLNSSGIVRFPQYHMDMVRLGIGLYGVGTSIPEKLQPVHRLKARISQIHTVPAQETIGYGRQGKAQQELRIATLSIGYADGFLRRAGNGHYSVLVHGRLAPTIGNICMDMSMIDVSDLPEAKTGDEVLLFGAELPVTQLAKCLETIPYEVFTGISERVKRVYFLE